VDDYADPCYWDGEVWTCNGWWQSIPRQVLHTATANGDIHLSGSGRVIISDVELSN
jgi:hypothetical protein